MSKSNPHQYEDYAVDDSEFMRDLSQDEIDMMIDQGLADSSENGYEETENILKRGEIWSRDETLDMISVAVELKIVQKMDTKQFTHQDLYQKVADTLREFGHGRSWKQVKDKYKHLKQKYLNARKTLNSSGAGTMAKDRCPFYEELHVLFGNRPVANQEGIDSLSSTGKRSATADDEREWERKRKTKPSAPIPSATNVSNSTDEHSASSTANGSTNKQVNLKNIFRDQQNLMNQYVVQQKSLDDRMMDRFERVSQQTVTALLSGLKDIGNTSHPTSPFMHVPQFFPNSYPPPFTPYGPYQSPPNGMQSQQMYYDSAGHVNDSSSRCTPTSTPRKRRIDLDADADDLRSRFRATSTPKDCYYRDTSADGPPSRFSPTSPPKKSHDNRNADN